MFWLAARILAGLICGALLGALVAIALVPRPVHDPQSPLSPTELEQIEDRRFRWVVVGVSIVSATIAGSAGRINLGRRTEFIAKGAMAGAFLAIVLTIVGSNITGDNPSVRDAQHGRVHAFGREFLLPFLMGTGVVAGWLWHRFSLPADERQTTDHPSSHS